MSNQHTTSAEDRAIRDCASVGGQVQELIDCIERLSGELDEAAKGVDLQAEEIADLQRENARLEKEYNEWVAERERIAAT